MDFAHILKWLGNLSEFKYIDRSATYNIYIFGIGSKNTGLFFTFKFTMKIARAQGASSGFFRAICCSNIPKAPNSLYLNKILAMPIYSETLDLRNEAAE